MESIKKSLNEASVPGVIVGGLLTMAIALIFFPIYLKLKIGFSPVYILIIFFLLLYSLTLLCSNILSSVITVEEVKASKESFVPIQTINPVIKYALGKRWKEKLRKINKEVDSEISRSILTEIIAEFNSDPLVLIIKGLPWQEAFGPGPVEEFIETKKQQYQN